MLVIFPDLPTTGGLILSSIDLLSNRAAVRAGTPLRVLFYEGDECCDMVPGKLIRMAPGRPHRLEAKQDSRLRPAPRERRHSTVFYAFDNLAPSESFLLVNDDPQPLHAQMEELRPGELTWEYEVQGPYEFRIKVSWVASSSAPRPETAMASCSH